MVTTKAIVRAQGNGIYFYQVQRGKRVIGTGITDGYEFENGVFTTSGLCFKNVSELIRH